MSGGRHNVNDLRQTAEEGDSVPRETMVESIGARGHRLDGERSVSARRSCTRSLRNVTTNARSPGQFLRGVVRDFTLPRRSVRAPLNRSAWDLTCCDVSLRPLGIMTQRHHGRRTTVTMLTTIERRRQTPRLTVSEQLIGQPLATYY